MDKIWRCANRLLMYHSKNKLLYLLGKLFEGVSFVVYSHAVSAKAKIGEGTEFFHHAIGCVVHEQAIIGNDCKIFQHVTIGAKWGSGRDGVPRIGNRVLIGAGAVILGDIEIGDDARVGANAVVIHSVPAGTLAVGFPGERTELKHDRLRPEEI